MAWLLVAIAAYFFGAIANVLDKFLLGSKRISSAIVYAFYIGLFGLGAFVLAPFGLHSVSGIMLWFCFLGGFLFLAGITLLYLAMERAQAGRVVPVVGAMIPLATFVLTAISGVEIMSAKSILAMCLLVGGGLLISFDLPLKTGKKKFFSGFVFAFCAGFVLAASYTVFKYISGHENFVTWYVWTRVGSAVSIIFFLLVPKWRKAICQSFSSARKKPEQAYSTGGIFISNKIIGGISTALVNFAIGIGSVTLVNALVSLQYVFVLVFVSMLSRKNHHIYQEKLFFWDWVQKIAAIIIIGLGIVLIS
jgi:drug/metabolite transporter (DMT)-like permease